MTLTVPSWFKQRQAKAEPAGDNIYKLTAPNVSPAYIGVRQGANGQWAAFFGPSADGPDMEATEPTFAKPADAWEAAFEIYRRVVI